MYGDTNYWVFYGSNHVTSKRRQLKEDNQFVRPVTVAMRSDLGSKVTVAGKQQIRPVTPAHAHQVANVTRGLLTRFLIMVATRDMAHYTVRDQTVRLRTPQLAVWATLHTPQGPHPVTLPLNQKRLKMLGYYPVNTTATSPTQRRDGKPPKNERTKRSTMVSILKQRYRKPPKL